MIIETVNSSDFHSAFHRMDRANNFSYDGRNELFDYLENLSDDAGTPYELDVIALCCEFSECDAKEIVEYYGEKGDSAEEVVETLRDKTTVIDVDPDRWIIAEF